MSKTPRTDEHLRMKEENGHAVIVSGDFARQLETELAEARAEIERKDVLIEQMRTTLIAARNGLLIACDDDEEDRRLKRFFAYIDSALAAERGE